MLLILNSRSSQKSVLLDEFGEFFASPKFSWEPRTGVYGSCSVLLKNKFYVFGGNDYYDYKDQISIVNCKKIERVGTLPFEFMFGACLDHKNEALLCFGYDRKE